jgi:hypothetical protein
MKFQVSKVREIPQLAEEVLNSNEGLCSVELIFTVDLRA